MVIILFRVVFGYQEHLDGSISFGLVNIPIKLFTVSDSTNEYSFNQLDKKGHKIQYKKWCPIEERNFL